MRIYFYIDNSDIDLKWESFCSFADLFQRLGADVFLFIDRCSGLNHTRLKCETKIENADLLVCIGKPENGKYLDVERKIYIADSLEEMGWASLQTWITEIWTLEKRFSDKLNHKVYEIPQKLVRRSVKGDRWFKGEEKREKTTRISCVMDNLMIIPRVLSIFEGYYCNINIECELHIFVSSELVNRSKKEIYKKVMELKSIGNISVHPYTEFAEYDNLHCCIYGNKLSSKEQICEIFDMGIPVISMESCVDNEILAAGIVAQSFEQEQIYRIIEVLLEHKEFRRKVIWNQFVRYAESNPTCPDALFIFKLSQLNGKKLEVKYESKQSKDKLEIQVQGPFETSYSLAIVNKKLAEAFHRMESVNASIGAMEASGTYEPRHKFLKDKEVAAKLWEKGCAVTAPYVAVRNMYPPAVEYMTAAFNFEAFGWEEDKVPKKYIRDFNNALDGIGTMSEFVTQALLDSGLSIPVKTIGIGVDLPEYYDTLEPYRFHTKKKIKFVHISSAFPRKGVDILLQAYCEEFSDDDDTCLIIKSFPNPHNKVAEQIKELQAKYRSMPEIEYINEDMDERELYSIYKAADCYVHVARGEGFGLPVAEAMLAKIPVIVSDNTGLADFCNEDTAMTVDYVMEKANSHLTENSCWAKPNKETLKKWMREFYTAPKAENVEKRVENAYKLISTYFTWDAVAQRWLEFIEETIGRQKKPSVAMVTTWNTKCGIAEFTKYFVEATKAKVDYQIFPNRSDELVRPDEEYVAKRWWDIGQAGDLLRPLKQSGADVIHIQFNFGLLSLQNLVDIIAGCARQKVIVTFHGTNDFGKVLPQDKKDSIIQGINKAYRLIVHQEQDKKNLVQYGISEKIISIVPLGQVAYPEITKAAMREKLNIQNKLVIGSYGFLFPHKGFDKVIKAVQTLKEIYPDVLYMMVCSLYDSEGSRKYYDQCLETIHNLKLEENVLIFTDFLNPEESMQLLQACDLLVMPYDDTTESASGAVRFCVAAKRPVITTEQDIFAEYADCTYQIKGNHPDKIAKAVKKLMDDELQQTYVDKISKKAAEMSWNKVGKLYIDLYKNM